MKVTPLQQYILIHPHEKEKKSKRGVFIPEALEEMFYEAHKATVVAVGDGTYKGETLVPHWVEVGDVVFFKKRGLVKVEHEGEEHYLVEEGHIIATVEGEGA